MKKTLLIVLSVIATLCFAFGFAACGGTHTHTYSDAWSADEEYHWHAATCEHSSEVTDKDKHDFKDGKCSVCGYEHGELRVSVDTKEFPVGAISDGVTITLSDIYTNGEKFADEIVICFSMGQGLYFAIEGDVASEHTYFFLKDGKVYIKIIDKDENGKEIPETVMNSYTSLLTYLRAVFIGVFDVTPEYVIKTIEKYLPNDMTLMQAVFYFASGVTPDTVKSFIDLYLPEGITVDGIIELIEKRASFEEIKAYIPESLKEEINAKLPEGITYDGIVALIEKLIALDEETVQAILEDNAVTIQELLDFLPEGVSAQAISALIPIDLKALGEEYAELLATFTEGTEELEFLLSRLNEAYADILEIIPDGITVEEVEGLLPEGMTLETLEEQLELKEGTLTRLIWLISGVTPEEIEALKDGVTFEEIEELLPEGFIDFIDGFIQGLPAMIYGDEYAETVNYDEFVVTYEGIKQFIINLTTLTEDDFNELLTDGVSLEEFEGLLPEEGLTVAGINVLLPEGFKVEDILGYLSNVTKENIDALEDGATVSEILALLPEGYEQMINAYLPEGITLTDIINAIESIPIEDVINALNDLSFESVVADAAEVDIDVETLKAELSQWVIGTLFVAKKDGDNVVFNLNYDLIKVLNDYLYTTTVKDVANAVFGEGWYADLGNKVNSVLDVTLEEILDSAKENGFDVIATLESVKPFVNAFIDVVMAKPTEPEIEIVEQEPYTEEIEQGEDEKEESVDYVGYVIDFLNDEENLKLTVGDVIVRIIDSKAISTAEALKAFINPVIDTVGNRTFYDLVLLFTGYYEDPMMLITKPSDEKAEETKATYKIIVESFVDYIKSTNPVSFTVNAEGKIVAINATINAMGSFSFNFALERGSYLDLSDIQAETDGYIETVDLSVENLEYSYVEDYEESRNIIEVTATEDEEYVTVKRADICVFSQDYDGQFVVNGYMYVYTYVFDKFIFNTEMMQCSFSAGKLPNLYYYSVLNYTEYYEVMLDDPRVTEMTEDAISTVVAALKSVGDPVFTYGEDYEDMDLYILEDGTVILEDDLNHYYYQEDDCEDIEEGNYEEVA